MPCPTGWPEAGLGPAAGAHSGDKLSAAVGGLGIGYGPENLVAEKIKSGQLAQLLDDWSPLFAGYHLYYPSRRQAPLAFSVIVNALRVPFT